MSNFITYANILTDRELFRKSGTKSGGEFNLTDTPGVKYFKIFFYFLNGDADGEERYSGGLLAPSWLSNPKENELYMYNSAWSYLKMNCEDERAELLEKFIHLLSNINSQSPWYFSELSGLDSALERKISERDFKIDEQRKKISIKCLPDAYDDRISTLLDLYRAIVWSWTTKREIIPSNLRKFDMGIFIYNDPIKPFNYINSDDFSYLGNNSSGQSKTSYKYIEFHNCEFDYDSTKSGLNGINNKEGLSAEYTIDIFFDDCYETHYNEFVMSTIGDLISWDINTNLYGNDSNSENKTELKNQIDKKMNLYGNDSNFLSNAFGQIINVGEDAVTGLVKRALLGNLYTFSLSKMASQAKGLIDGNIWSTMRGVSEYIKDDQQRKENQLPIGHSLFIKSQKILPTVKRIGNLASSQTIANNL